MARARRGGSGESGGFPWNAPVVVALLGLLLVLAAGLGGGWSFTPRFGLWDMDIPDGSQRDIPQRTMPPPELNGPVAPMPLWFKITLALVALALLAGVAYLVWRRWPRRVIRVERVEIDRPVAPEPDVKVLRQGAVDALDLLDQIRDPQDAVVRCWLALELAAERSGVPRDPSSTPSEFAAGLLTSTSAQPEAVEALLGLYHRARFSAHPVGIEEVQRARTCVGRLSASWRSYDDALRASVT